MGIVWTIWCETTTTKGVSTNIFFPLFLFVLFLGEKKQGKNDELDGSFTLTAQCLMLVRLFHLYSSISLCIEEVCQKFKRSEQVFEFDLFFANTWSRIAQTSASQPPTVSSHPSNLKRASFSISSKIVIGFCLQFFCHSKETQEELRARDNCSQLPKKH